MLNSNILNPLIERNMDMGPMSRVFANGPGDRASIPDQVLPKTQKMILVTVLLNTQYYKVRIKGKVEQYSGVTPYQHRCCSNGKGSLHVTLD